MPQALLHTHTTFAATPVSAHTARGCGRAGGVLCVVAVLLALLFSGCAKPKPWEVEDPTEALKVFLVALEVRSLDTAWEFLLPEDRAVLEARKVAFDAMTDDSVEREAWAFLSPGHVVSTAGEYRDVRVDEEASDAEHAAVVVELHDERSFTVHMLRRDGRWYVDIPLAQANPAPSRQGGSNE